MNGIRTILSKAIQDSVFEDKVYFAGGCVRDSVLNREIIDFDVAVELPDGGILLAEHLCQKGIASNLVVYKQFGTALVTIGNTRIEIVMTRQESYRHKSRKPVVAFGTILDDIMRRDFTINSLLMRVSDGKIFDLCGVGLYDIKEKLIRATSSPDIIFKEDPLRHIRAIRFASTLGFDLERKTAIAIKKYAQEIKNISSERVTAELLKILTDKNFLRGLHLLSKFGVKQYLFPKLRVYKRFYQLGEVFSKTDTKQLSIPSLSDLSVLSRFALYFWSCKDVDKYLTNLKLSKQDKNHVKWLVQTAKHTKIALLSRASEYRKLAYLIGDYLDEFVSFYPYAIMLETKDDTDTHKALIICQQIQVYAHELTKYRFNLTGEDLIRTFCIQPGPKISLMLSLALNYWLGEPQADKKELLAYLKREENIT